MSKISNQTQVGKTVYVYGSDLMPVPYGRINDIPKVKQEFHEAEVRMAIMAARTRKLA